MARLSKIVKMDDREITVRELRVRDVSKIFTEVSETDGDVASMMAKAKELLPLCMDVDSEYIMDLAPSEVKELYAAFKEVNAVFFDTLKDLGLDKVLGNIKNDLTKNLTPSSAASLPQGTEQ